MKKEVKKYYNQKDDIIKPYAFSVFFRHPQINANEILVENKQFEMNTTIENYVIAIIIYNAFNHQKDKKFSINGKNKWKLNNFITECPYIKEKYIIDTKYDKEIGLLLD